MESVFVFSLQINDFEFLFAEEEETNAHDERRWLNDEIVNFSMMIINRRKEENKLDWIVDCVACKCMV